MKVLCDFQWQADKGCSKETPDWKALDVAKALTSWALTKCKVMVSDILIKPSMDLTPGFTEPKAKRKILLKVKCFNEASLRGSKEAFVSW